ncbi:MAG: acyltransferase [Alphaproteobacteria bacterium]|nr:acyltransferase [Alphaproteobacteria bacterium]
MKNILIRILSGLMPTRKLRHRLRNCLTVGFGKTKNRGKNNKIVWIDAQGRRHIMRRLPGWNICFRGDNNYIEIHGSLEQMCIDVKMYGNSRIVIGNKRVMSNKIFKISGMENCELNIGDDLLTDGSCDIVFSANTKITIGVGCMIANSVYIRTGDGHSILHKNKVINKNADVYIGNHVWVADGVCILKGASIPDNSIVGARSLVNKKFTDKNVIIAGIPAKIVKSGIDWDMQSVC